MDSTGLKKAYDDVKAAEFPAPPQDDSLADWVMELLEVDGYYAGLAESALGGAPYEPPADHTLDSLKRIYSDDMNLSPRDLAIRASAREYLAYLLELHSVLVSGA